MKIRNRYKVLFIVFVVLGVYYPAIFDHVNSIDDWKMLINLQDAAHLNWKGLFLPGHGFYYRPLLMLTFWCDKFLWGLTPSFMHLENILIHALNAVLVFLLARKVFAAMRMERPELPLLSALLFALHPINTESINWISGRTDPLATVFVLSSTLLLVRGIEKKNNLSVLAAAFLFMAGILSKEMVVFFLPAGIFLIWRWPQENTENGIGKIRVRQMVVYASPLLAALLGYIVVRQTLLVHHASGLGDILARTPYDFFNAVRVFFKAFGFYVKKLFIPVPLNFAIVKVNNQYVWLGLAAFAATLWMARRRSPAVMMLVISFYQILPAIIIALATVAWTPVAERYLYLPSAFFAVGMVGGGYQLLRRWHREFVLAPVLGLLLFPAALVTVQRNLVWQSNLSLFRDTIKKSPQFASIRNELAIALMEHGDNAEAKVQLLTGQKEVSGRHDPLLYVNEANLLLRENKPLKARQELIAAGVEEASANVEMVKMLARIDEKRLFAKNDPDVRVMILRELVATYQRIYEKNEDPAMLYRRGQLALTLGERSLARDCFAKAYAEAPEGAFYKLAAKKLTTKLSGG